MRRKDNSQLSTLNSPLKEQAMMQELLTGKTRLV